MTFMGLVQTGTQVRVTLSADTTNSGSALLAAGTGKSAQGGSKVTTVAPGGSRTLTIKCDKEGLLKVEVDFKRANDSGTLQVERPPLPPDQEEITGDQTWRYAIVDDISEEPTT